MPLPRFMSPTASSSNHGAGDLKKSSSPLNPPSKSKKEKAITGLGVAARRAIRPRRHQTTEVPKKQVAANVKIGESKAPQTQSAYLDQHPPHPPTPQTGDSLPKIDVSPNKPLPKLPNTSTEKRLPSTPAPSVYMMPTRAQDLPSAVESPRRCFGLTGDGEEFSVPQPTPPMDSSKFVFGTNNDNGTGAPGYSYHLRDGQKDKAEGVPRGRGDIASALTEDSAERSGTWDAENESGFPDVSSVISFRTRKANVPDLALIAPTSLAQFAVSPPPSDTSEEVTMARLVEEHLARKTGKRSSLPRPSSSATNRTCQPSSALTQVMSGAREYDATTPARGNSTWPRQTGPPELRVKASIPNLQGPGTTAPSYSSRLPIRSGTSITASRRGGNRASVLSPGSSSTKDTTQRKELPSRDGPPVEAQPQIWREHPTSTAPLLPAARQPGWKPTVVPPFRTNIDEVSFGLCQLHGDFEYKSRNFHDFETGEMFHVSGWVRPGARVPTPEGMDGCQIGKWKPHSGTANTEEGEGSGDESDDTNSEDFDFPMPPKSTKTVGPGDDHTEDKQVEPGSSSSRPASAGKSKQNVSTFGRTNVRTPFSPQEQHRRFHQQDDYTDATDTEDENVARYSGKLPESTQRKCRGREENETEIANRPLRKVHSRKASPFPMRTSSLLMSPMRAREEHASGIVARSGLDSGMEDSAQVENAGPAETSDGAQDGTGPQINLHMPLEDFLSRTSASLTRNETNEVMKVTDESAQYGDVSRGRQGGKVMDNVKDFFKKHKGPVLRPGSSLNTRRSSKQAPRLQRVATVAGPTSSGAPGRGTVEIPRRGSPRVIDVTSRASTPSETSLLNVQKAAMVNVPGRVQNQQPPRASPPPIPVRNQARLSRPMSSVPNLYPAATEDVAGSAPAVDHHLSHRASVISSSQENTEALFRLARRTTNSQMAAQYAQLADWMVELNKRAVEARQAYYRAMWAAEEANVAYKGCIEALESVWQQVKVMTNGETE